MSITRDGTSASSTSKGKAHYLFDLDGFSGNVTELLEAFRRFYGNFDIAYSFKTNYLKAACDTILSLGCCAEVVSPFEYEYAKQLGFPDRRIIFNGVIPCDVKYSVLRAGGMVNVDCLDEYLRLEALAEREKAHISVGVRVNFEVDGATSRFGVDLTGDDFKTIIRRVARSRFVSLGGFHHHLHGRRSVRYWKRRALTLAAMVKEYDARYVDLGGGMWGKMPESLSRQFSEKPDAYADYGKQIGGILAEMFPDASVKLIIEPGIGLVGTVMECVSHVVGIKSICGKQYVQLDIDGADTAFDYNCDANRIRKPFRILRSGETPPVRLTGADFVGTTCTEIDTLVRDFNGELSVGDAIIFENVGAYSLVTSRQFITPRLGVYDAQSRECLLNPETSDDMFRNYLNF